jgi:hypothetical protein
MREEINLAGDYGLPEGTGEGVDNRQEHRHAKEEPKPLDRRHHRYSAHVAGDDHQHWHPKC